MNRSGYSLLPTSSSHDELPRFVDSEIPSLATTPSLPRQHENISIGIHPKTPSSHNIHLPPLLPLATSSLHHPLEPDTPTEPLQGRIIKLVGIPPRDGGDPESTAFQGEEDSPCLKDVRDVELPVRPPCVYIGVDEMGRPIVDCVDSLQEDPFTLDSFEKMIRAHARVGKDFLMARVATGEEGRFYWSYYGAHQINKVLFRTQPEEGLLHRMKARNPLNNMVVVGDVCYYVIKAMAVNVALQTNRSTAPITVASSLAISENGGLPATTAAVDNKHRDTVVSHSAHQLTVKINRFMQLNNSGTSNSSCYSSCASSPASPVKRVAGRNVDSVFAGDGDGLESDDSKRCRYQGQENKHAQGKETILSQVDRFTAFLEGLQSESGVDYCTDFAMLRERYLEETRCVARVGGKRKFQAASFANSSGAAAGLSFEEWLSRTASVGGEKGKVVVGRDVGDEGEGGKLFYVAEYFASDDDFLMKSSVRAVFRENALEAEDAVLFTLPGTNVGNGGARGGDAGAAFLGGENGQVNMLVTSKRLKVFVFLYFSMSLLVVNCLVPSDYYYHATFSMVFMLCLFLIIIF
ncbi:hypothetical protein HDU98_005991 [Podochytrium sp. JEL0797]|nr:hypothetical protein HDU98_005991 [Podochytrium sp. JEL0797]